MSRRAQWFLAAAAAVLAAVVLELAGEWSAAIEVVVLGVVFAIIGLRSRRPGSSPAGVDGEAASRKAR
jgi:hypothetical protein